MDAASLTSIPFNIVEVVPNMHISVTPRHMFKGRNFASLETTCDVTDMCIRGGKRRKQVDFSPLRRALFLPTRIDDRQVFRVPGDLLALSLSLSPTRSVGRSEVSSFSHPFLRAFPAARVVVVVLSCF